ncbi:MAG TPA: Gfo/Idh/MocA family oxidoreductase [Casimicrobiaceae bacterium]|nr:Gfo/Idh/MocA family oxidoreductase [Casimicrobiaceae bacterium]
MRRIGVGLIGLGMAVKPHLLALADLADRVDVIGGFSRSPQRRDAFAKQWRLPALASLDDLLDDTRVDAFLIATPPRTHGELALRAARAGKHVLVEKPLDIDYPSAARVVDEVELVGRTFGVVFQHRFREGAIALREKLAAHALGDLVSISASIRWWRSFEYFREPGRGMLERDAGGVLLTQAIHTLDLLLDLVGPAHRVSASCRTSGLREIDTEDIACATVEYANGAVGVIDATTTAFPGHPERIDIAGTRGSAVLAAESLRIDFHDVEPFVFAGSSAGGGGADPMAFSHESHRRLIDDFVVAVLEKRQPQASARSALRVQALIDAMLLSSRESRPVTLAATR